MVVRIDFTNLSVTLQKKFFSGGKNLSPPHTGGVPDTGFKGGIDLSNWSDVNLEAEEFKFLGSGGQCPI